MARPTMPRWFKFTRRAVCWSHRSNGNDGQKKPRVAEIDPRDHYRMGYRGYALPMYQKRVSCVPHGNSAP
jgi:hypothetical protein